MVMIWPGVSIDPLDEPFSRALAVVETERLLLNRLTGPPTAGAAATGSDSWAGRRRRPGKSSPPCLPHLGCGEGMSKSGNHGHAPGKESAWPR